MVTGLVFGAFAGFGVFLVVRGLFPAPRSVTDDIESLRRPRWEPTGTSGAQARVNRVALGLLRLPGTDPESVDRDLAVIGKTVERHAIDKLTLLGLGAGLPLLVGVVTGLADVSLPIGVLALAVLFMGAGGWFFADADLHSDAATRRRDFRHALSVYLDLVNVMLAGGSGVEGALDDAASVGDGWAFVQLRQALATARLNRESPWTTFDRLSARIGVTELSELSSSISLAGDSGARIRESLSAKAVAMRDHELTQTQSEAEAASERMSLPLVAMATGFILLVGYPAVSQVLSF